MSERHSMKTWDLPDITTDEAKTGEQRNALNKPRKWHYEPPEQEAEEQEPEPLTAQQLEEIREAAREEGFKAGFEQGYQEGVEQGEHAGLEQGREKGFQSGFEQGLADGKAKMAEAEQRLAHVINGLAQPTQQLTETLRQQLLELVLNLTRTILKIITILLTKSTSFLKLTKGSSTDTLIAIQKAIWLTAAQLSNLDL